MERSCEKCGWSKFDEQWGEYLCLKKQHTVYNLDEAKKCELYKERIKKDKKE